MRAARLALWAALLLVACSSAKKSAPSKEQDDASSAPGFDDTRDGVLQPPSELLVLRQVLVEESSEGGLLAMPSEAMAKSLGKQLVTSGTVAAREGAAPEGQRSRRVEVILTLSYDWAPEAEPGAGALVLAAEARMEFVEGRGDLAPGAAVLMEAMVPRPPQAPAERTVGQEALDELAAAATRALGESLIAKERLRQASHAELLSALSVGLGETDMKIWALQLSAQRNLREAVPAAIEALASEDEALRATATSVLVEFGDPRAVPAIINDVDFADHDELRVAIEAACAIGGEEAEEFLEFVATGHSEQELRQHARENLELLRRKAGSSSR